MLDIPLLFEGLGERRVDATLVVSAPAFLQRHRVMARPGMTAERLDGILRQQVPDALKRRKADHRHPDRARAGADAGRARQGGAPS